MWNRFRTKGGLAVVTGASSGIGLELAGLLAERGMKVIVTARREELLTTVANKWNSSEKVLKAGGLLVPMPGDVNSREHHDDVIAAIKMEGDSLDLLVNNAGRGYNSSISEGIENVERELFELNLWSPLALTRNLLPQLKNAANGGHRPTVVNVSSVVGYVPFQGLPIYSATKAALTSLTDSMRNEFAQEEIWVIGSHPGLTATPFNVNSERNEGTKKPRRAQSGRSPRKQSKYILRSVLRRKRIADPPEGFLARLFHLFLPRTTDFTMKNIEKRLR